jgi:hypothetical protein
MRNRFSMEVIIDELPINGWRIYAYAYDTKTFKDVRIICENGEELWFTLTEQYIVDHIYQIIYDLDCRFGNRYEITYLYNNLPLSDDEIDALEQHYYSWNDRNEDE